jgi:hypothetical protein
MPSKGYAYKMTHEHVLRLFQEGVKYRADLKSGVLYSGRTNLPLFTYTNRDQDYLFVRVYDKPFCTGIAVSRVVWMVGTGVVIPEGFQIHHHNEKPWDNAFTNLICLHHNDHEKWHQTQTDESYVPF